MLNWKIDRIRYAPDKMTLVVSDPANPGNRGEIHVTLEQYNGSLAAVARADKEVIWYSKVTHK